MLGRVVGAKRAPEKVERFGENAPPRTKEHMLDLGCNPVEPEEASPSYCPEFDRFETDVAGIEYARRQQEAERRQVQIPVTQA